MHRRKARYWVAPPPDLPLPPPASPDRLAICPFSCQTPVIVVPTTAHTTTTCCIGQIHWTERPTVRHFARCRDWPRTKCCGMLQNSNDPSRQQKGGRSRPWQLDFRAAQNFQITATLITSTSLSSVAPPKSPPTS